MRPTRTPPAIGVSARIWHFGGESEPATIVDLLDGGRCVVVAAADGRRREFTLRRVSARFIERGEQHAPHLDF